MLTQRSEGLRRLLLICQIWITAGLFWLGVWVMVKFYSPGGGLTWRRYSIYCVLLVLGLTLEFLGRDSSRDYPLQTDLLREHRVSLRQTVASIGMLVIYLIATKDGFISRVFLFNFVPCFYLALLFSHHYLPPFLARRFFKGIRREKTVLVGSPARAAQLLLQSPGPGRPYRRGNAPSFHRPGAKAPPIDEANSGTTGAG